MYGLSTAAMGFDIASEGSSARRAPDPSLAGFSQDEADDTGRRGDIPFWTTDSGTSCSSIGSI